MKKPVLGKITPLCLLLGIAVSTAYADSLTWDPLLNSGGGGTGTWNLNTTANWYNGTTDVTWKDNSTTGTNAAIFGGTAGTVTVANALSASTLQLNATGYTFSGSGVLTLGSGGINATNLTSGTTTIGIGLSLPLGQQGWQVGTGATLAVNGAVTRSPGASVDFSVPGITSTTLNNDATGILGAWATVGSLVSSNATGDWAANDGAGNIIAYTGYTLMTGSVDGSTGAAQNWESAAPGNVITFTGNANLNSLVMQGDVIVSNGFTMTLGSGGLILKGISRWLIDQTGGTVGNAIIMSGSPNGEFFVHVPNGNTANNGADGGNWRIWPQIKDNGATPLKLIKDGPGFVGLQNTNTYTGGTWINNGILAAGGVDTSVAIAPVTLGSGDVTINPQGIMEIGYGTGNANVDYLYPNNVILNGGKILADDGHNRVTGTINVTAAGGTLGSTYDGGGNGTTGNKALFIDGVVSGSGPLALQQAVDAGDNDRYGNGGGNPYNSSVVEFGNAANTYSGIVTVVPYSTGAGAGSYVAINASTALQFATLNLDNNTGGHRYAGVNGTFSQLVFNTGIGSATVAAITGPGNIILNGFNENTYAVASDPVTLTLGNGANSTISGIITGSGGLTKIGNGSLTLSGANNYTGTTTVSGGSVVLTGAWLNSSNIVIGTGRTLDASALGTVTMPGSQALQSDGTLTGSVNTSFGSAIYGNGDGTYGTNAITGSLTLATGAAAFMDVGAVVNGANDRVTVGGTLTANNNSVHLKAPNTSVSLETADYVLFSSPNNISGTFATTPIWDVAPANANHYSIVTGAKTVTLHYSAVGGPGGVGSTSPSPALRNQSLLITVTAANGTAGTVNSVVVDASSLGGSSTLSLVNSGGNVWTNSVIVPFDLTTGIKSLVATVTDTATLTAIANFTATITAGNDVWNGGGADDNLSTSLNWTNHMAPALIGDSLQFAGSTRLTPNVDLNYVVTGILFNTNAGAFNIGSASSTLTLTNGSGVVNNSANVQTLSTPVALGASQTFATISNDIVVSGIVADGGSSAGLTKTGTHTLTLSGANTYTGPTVVNRGILNVTGSAGVTTANSSTFIGSVPGNSVLNLTGSGSLSAFYLLLGNTNNAVGALYQTAGTLDASANSGFDNLSVGNMPGGYGYYAANGGTFNVNGICIGGEVNAGGGANFAAAGGNGIMEINGGAVTDVGWLVMARQNGGTVGPSTGILNVYNGSLTFAGGGLVGPWDTGEKATINIMGGSVTSSQGVRLGNTGYQGILNLNGGLLSVSDISGYNGPGFAIVTNGLLNLNGGTLQAAASTTDFIRVSAARVYSGGLTVDNNGNGIVINQSLVAPSGNGVNGITSFTGGAGYIAPPIVTVTNGVGDTTGTGATAIAQINPTTGIVTNVVITCPGVNYTATPIFVLSGGGATTPATITGIAPTANTGGGVTFIGSSVTELTATNTYAGSTVVGAGTLELANPVIPSASTMIVSNGALVQLDFSVTNTIAGLVLNGVSQAQGVYNSTTSPTFITGPGSLLVGTTTVIANNPTNITFSVTGNGPGASMTISWPADHLGWILQQATNLTVGGWTDVPGTASSTSAIVPVTATPPDKYYRLRHP
jgi:fibronectin-binding autotransporter adhesin